MLPAAHRMRRRTDFEAAVRRGRRAGRRTLVVHASLNPDPGSAEEAARVGFVVSRSVGTAVVRNRVKRRLRSAMAARTASLPVGVLVVVRANPASGSVSQAVLAADLDVALPRVLAHAVRGSGAAPGDARRRAGQGPAPGGVTAAGVAARSQDQGGTGQQRGGDQG